MRKVRYAFIIVAALTAALFVLNIFMGSVRIPWREVSAVLFGGDGVSDPAIRFIVVESRLPGRHGPAGGSRARRVGPDAPDLAA